jgi:integrase/recombinase XerD
MTWTAQKVISPGSRQVGWVVVDALSLMPHPVAAEFYLFLGGGSRSPNTARAYMRAVAEFLSYSDTVGLVWRSARLGELARYKLHLEQRRTPAGGLQAPATLSLALTAVCEFLRFAVAQGHTDAHVAEQLSVRRYLRHPPRGFDAGENGQFRDIRARVLRVAVAEHVPAVFGAGEVSTLLRAASSARDRFVITLLHDTGLRSGEMLGLRRDELHLLPDSNALGCRVRGAHVHVPPRRISPNQARSKSGARVVPVEATVVVAYRDYSAERFDLLGVDGSDHVLVNLAGPAAGRPMSYSNLAQVLGRLGRRVGVRATAHMFRHTAATNWLAAGVAPDVVSTLLGHTGLQSVSVYAHPSSDTLQAAVLAVHTSRPS